MFDPASVTKTFDWYKKTEAINKVKIHAGLIIISLLGLIYYQDKKNDERLKLSNDRYDALVALYSKDQAHYFEKLEFYTEKFMDVMEKQNQEKIK